MTPESFTYWLQGFVELSKEDMVPNEKQWLMIKDHLKLVFDKKTPDRNQFPKIKSIDEVLKEMYKQPNDTSIWKVGDPVLTATC